METKTNWALNEIVTPDDMNRIEKNIQDLDEYNSKATNINAIEASTSNIIDFNTLTTEGIYIIKNATSSTTSNSPSLGSSGTVILEVGNKDDIIYQSIMTITNNGIPYHRQYNSGTWSSWLSTIASNLIRAGALNSGMSCNTPTADTHIVNKKYVDDTVSNAISSSITTALGGSY